MLAGPAANHDLGNVIGKLADRSSNFVARWSITSSRITTWGGQRHWGSAIRRLTSPLLPTPLTKRTPRADIQIHFFVDPLSSCRANRHIGTGARKVSPFTLQLVPPIAADPHLYLPGAPL
ncbi:hypothetical protein VTJ04DRAFT_10942 [Mycothermus thermophilus]|uniref:uncharacterized protein n=1 Tax=Humicola insolens TaxID=85995 RepID=UPI0037421B49